MDPPVQTDTEPLRPNYYQDVVPIFEARCVNCHVEGGIGTFALTSYEAAKTWAGPIAMKTATREMPPWPPGQDSPSMYHDRSLSDDELSTILKWVELGVPEGDAATRAAPGVPDVVEIGASDVTSDIGVDYVPDASLADDYRCFVVELGTTLDHMAIGYRITPGNRKTVHHVITTLYDAADRDALLAIDAATPERAGWPCVGGPTPQSSSIQPVGQLGAWVPGVSSVLTPAGTGNFVAARAIAVMQVHYNLAGGTAPDRTKIEIQFAPAGTESSLQRLTTVRLVKLRLDIPANTPDVVMEETHAASQWALGRFYPDGDAQVLGVAGHMHMLGTQLILERTRNGVTTTLLDIPAWDFHWQGAYWLKDPIDVQRTDDLTVRCIYDNTMEHKAKVGSTTPMGTVTWGEGTGDEMCIGYLSVVDRVP